MRTKLHGALSSLSVCTSARRKEAVVLTQFEDCCRWAVDRTAGSPPMLSRHEATVRPLLQVRSPRRVPTISWYKCPLLSGLPVAPPARARRAMAPSRFLQKPLLAAG